LTHVRSGSENAAVPRVRLLAALAVACVAAGFVAGPGGAGRTSLQARLAEALRGSGVSPARAGVLAVDMVTGKTVFALNPWRPLAPASNEKLAVTFAALEALGPAFRIETTVLGQGRLEGSTWRGDLVLRGRGDPTLSRAGLAELAQEIRAQGIRRVTGSILGDETYFDSRRIAYGWKSEFYVNESPPLGALAVDRSNAVDPALEATAAFRAALVAAGVRVDGRSLLGRATATSFPLASILSPPLRDLVRFMDTESDNYTAELLLKQLGASLLHQGTGPAGAAVVVGTLRTAHIPVAGLRIVDGSGLSRLDRLTAGAIVALLRAAYADPLVRPTFLAALAVAGRTGTLADRLQSPPARGNVVAKTGTTSAASALSGFVKVRYAFAILQNGNPVPAWSARAAQDRFAAVLASE
jgi:D-alanyl-D-alanine carboxypeptidase/D-alanyl-D-alanine-endopeptidase (penicillin-binding protein 4)